MPHFFINSTNVCDKKITINDEENYKHIARSLRARRGEKLLLIDEKQIQYETIIDEITNKEIRVNIEKSYASNRNLGFELYLAQSPLRSDAQSFVIEKATELGVSGVYPVYTDNCAVSKEMIVKKISKWQKIMYEASKQCERAVIPKCYNMTDLEQLIKSGEFGCIIAFCERLAHKTLRQYIMENINIFDKMLVIIGPEGGFSEEEFEMFKVNNIPMLTLGDLILKAETAVTVGLGNIIYEYNNSKSN